MSEFCDNCVDKGSEICALPTAGEKIKHRLALATGYISAGIDLVGSLCLVTDAEEVGTNLSALRERIADEQTNVDACIRAHDPNVVLTDTPRPFGSQR